MFYLCHQLLMPTPSYFLLQKNSLSVFSAFCLLLLEFLVHFRGTLAFSQFFHFNFLLYSFFFNF